MKTEQEVLDMMAHKRFLLAQQTDKTIIENMQWQIHVLEWVLE